MKYVLTIVLLITAAGNALADEKKPPAKPGPATRPTTSPTTRRAAPLDPKVNFTRNAIGSLSVALDAYEIDNAQYPTTAQGLKALIVKPAGLNSWRGPYITRLINDPWDHPFVYKSPGVHNPTYYDLSSHGPDGRESKDDIDNWTRP